MKKLSILTLTIACGLTAAAQPDVVKEAEHALKSGSVDVATIRSTIAPALTNAETKDNATAWFIAGKNEFNNYDALYQKIVILRQEGDTKDMGHSLITGYNHFMTAFPLDTVINEKGKVKTKHSKDMAKIIAAHFNDYDIAARYLWEAEDYMGAYDAWQIFLTLPSNPSLGKDAPTAPHDTIVGEYYYNSGLAAWQADKLDLALEAILKGTKIGYKTKPAYDYAISLAAQLGRNDTVYALAAEAMPLYGKEDPKYISLVINGYIEKKDYTTAQHMLEQAIAADPTDPQLYNVQGVLYESQKTDGMTAEQKEALDEQAIACYRKALDVNADFANANYNFGRKITEQAFNINDKAAELPTAEYIKVKDEQILPKFREAAVYLEKAYEIDPDNQADALRYLRTIYYNLGDEENLQRVESLR